VVVFDDETLLHKPVEQWPLCDVLLAFFSTGFPLAKAQAYAELRSPLLLNDLQQQHTLRDRQRVYEELAKAHVATPRYACVRRCAATGACSDVLVETEDAVCINGLELRKPFVEKPLDADDHNVYIYYPSRAGGGSKRLFRKVGNCSRCCWLVCKMQVPRFKGHFFC
jgi:inositol-hexakisphosphate/diphosphoinositol-pentakisphosphate 1-kinase